MDIDGQTPRHSKVQQQKKQCSASTAWCATSSSKHLVYWRERCAYKTEVNADQNGKISFRQVPSNQSTVHALNRPHRLSSLPLHREGRHPVNLRVFKFRFTASKPRAASHSCVTMGRCDASRATRCPGRGRPAQLPAAAFPPSFLPFPTPLPAPPRPGIGTTRPWRPVSDTSPVSADRRPWASRPRGAPRRPGPPRRKRRRPPPCCRSLCRPGAAPTSPTWPRPRLLDAPA